MVSDSEKSLNVVHFMVQNNHISHTKSASQPWQTRKFTWFWCH